VKIKGKRKVTKQSSHATRRNDTLTSFIHFHIIKFQIHY
jgi:hypothetical protein